KPRGGMALQAAAVLAVGEELFLLDGADRPIEGVEQRRGVAFREHEPVGSRMVGAGDVVAEMAGEQDRPQLDRRQRRGGVAGSCLVGGPQDVHSNLPAQILDAYAFLAHLRLLRTLPAPSGQRRATPRPTPYAGEQWSTTPKGPGVSEPRSLERR